jgi:hypothetical protein
MSGRRSIKHLWGVMVSLSHWPIHWPIHWISPWLERVTDVASQDPFLSKDGNYVPVFPKTCPMREQDKYWYFRKRVPFRGPIHGHIWYGLVGMRYQFTLNGTIGVNGNPPSTAGDPHSPAVSGLSAGQVYGPLTTTHNKDLFGSNTKDSRMIWSKELFDFLIAEVAAGKDISCQDYPESAMDVRWALEILGVGGRMPTCWWAVVLEIPWTRMAISMP